MGSLQRYAASRTPEWLPSNPGNATGLAPEERQWPLLDMSFRPSFPFKYNDQQYDALSQEGPKTPTVDLWLPPGPPGYQNRDLVPAFSLQKYFNMGRQATENAVTEIRDLARRREPSFGWLSQFT